MTGVYFLISTDIIYGSITCLESYHIKRSDGCEFQVEIFTRKIVIFYLISTSAMGTSNSLDGSSIAREHEAEFQNYPATDIFDKLKVNFVDMRL